MFKNKWQYQYGHVMLQSFWKATYSGARRSRSTNVTIFARGALRKDKSYRHIPVRHCFIHFGNIHFVCKRSPIIIDFKWFSFENMQVLTRGPAGPPGPLSPALPASPWGKENITFGEERMLPHYFYWILPSWTEKVITGLDVIDPLMSLRIPIIQWISLSPNPLQSLFLHLKWIKLGRRTFRYSLTATPLGPGNPITPGCPLAPAGPGGPGRPSCPEIP